MHLTAKKQLAELYNHYYPFGTTFNSIIYVNDEEGINAAIEEQDITQSDFDAALDEEYYSPNDDYFCINVNDGVTSFSVETLIEEWNTNEIL